MEKFLNCMNEKIFDYIKQKTLSLKKNRTGLTFFCIKLFSLALAFLMGVIATRLMTLREYGIYSYVTNWLFLLQIISIFGLNQIVVKEISRYYFTENWNSVKGIVSWSNKVVLGFALILCIISSTAVFFYGNITSFLYTKETIILFISLPLLALTVLRQNTLHGLQKTELSQLPLLIIQPVMFLVSICLIKLVNLNLRSGIEFDLELIAWLKLLSVVSGFIAASFFLSLSLPKTYKFVEPEYKINLWKEKMLPCLLIGSTYLISNRVDIFMLGLMSSPESVGLYTVASRGGELVSFATIAGSMAFIPTISTLVDQRNFKLLQSKYTRVTKLTSVGALLIALSLCLFGRYYLLLFGKEYLEAYFSLIILSVGQLIIAFIGPSGHVLTMSGNERVHAVNVVFGFLLNIVINIFMIPFFGMNGAAVATLISTGFLNISMSFAMYKKLNLSPFPVKFTHRVL